MGPQSQDWGPFLFRTRTRSVALLLLLLGFADVSVALPTGGAAVPACGGQTWRELGEAIEGYCRDAPDERLGCRVALYAFSHCEAAPDLVADDDGTLRGSIRDPRDRSYAWLLTFARARGGWLLERFKYEYDDCDAIGVPLPPRGPIRLRDLRRAPDWRIGPREVAARI